MSTTPRGKPVGPNLAAFSKWLMDEMAENPFA
jgi:hypothetical protein